MVTTAITSKSVEPFRLVELTWNQNKKRVRAKHLHTYLDINEKRTAIVKLNQMRWQILTRSIYQPQLEYYFPIYFILLL